MSCPTLAETNGQPVSAEQIDLIRRAHRDTIPHEMQAEQDIGLLLRALDERDEQIRQHNFWRGFRAIEEDELRSQLAASLASEQRSQAALAEREEIIERQRRELVANDAALTAVRAERPEVEELRALVRRNGEEWCIEDIQALLKAIDDLQRTEAAWRNSRDVYEAEKLGTANKLRLLASLLDGANARELLLEARVRELQEALQYTSCDCIERGKPDANCKRCAALAQPQAAKEQQA